MESKHIQQMRKSIQDKKKELFVLKKVLIFLKSFVFKTENDYQDFVKYVLEQKCFVRRSERSDFVKKFLSER